MCIPIKHLPGLTKNSSKPSPSFLSIREWQVLQNYCREIWNHWVCLWIEKLARVCSAFTHRSLMSKVDKKNVKNIWPEGKSYNGTRNWYSTFFSILAIFLAFFSKKLIARFLVAHLGMTLYMTFASSDFKELGGVMVMRPDCDTKGYGFKSQEMPKLFFFSF